MSSKLEDLPFGFHGEDICRCAVCRKFNKQVIGWVAPHHYGKNGLGVWHWKNPEGSCSLCYSTHKLFAPFVPTIVREFVGPRICGGCRNVICSYVLNEWRLCFAQSTDDAIKWALTDMYRNQFINHFYHNGASRSDFNPRECCKHNHGRKRRSNQSE